MRDKRIPREATYLSKERRPRSCYLSLAEQLKKAIENSGEPGGTIAKGAGIPQPVLHRFATGERPNIRLDTADKVCRYFGLELTTAKRTSR